LEIELIKNKSDAEIYSEISEQLEQFILPSDKLQSSLSNFTALLKEAFDKISWVGFYIENNGKLFLGPFQGKTACTEIKLGTGVCGTASLTCETIIVDDVNKFPGHIACDSDSKSEIVIPIIVDGKLWGVLDVDSYKKTAFTELDKNNLEIFCKFLSNKLELNKFILC
jgi:GAF domain-containing protein